jgi:TonB-dependent SusC/RagA subfamily outer membrane receptor
VDVIKDGSSAIYGMQGANGVIIITTVGAGSN